MLKYFIPGVVISLTLTTAYILINIPKDDKAGGSALALLRGFLGGLVSVPVSLVQTLGKLFKQKPGTLVKKKQALPNAALVTPVLPLAALYCGPFNMYGMGTGIATILTNLNFLPASALYGLFSGVGYLQGIADPTNSYNTWLAGFAGVDATAVMKKVLPYAWAACVMMMIFVAILQ